MVDVDCTSKLVRRSIKIRLSCNMSTVDRPQIVMHCRWDSRRTGLLNPPRSPNEMGHQWWTLPNPWQSIQSTSSTSKMQGDPGRGPWPCQDLSLESIPTTPWILPELSRPWTHIHLQQSTSRRACLSRSIRAIQCQHDCGQIVLH